MNNTQVRFIFVSHGIIVNDKIFEILDSPIDTCEASLGYVFEYNTMSFTDKCIWQITDAEFDSVRNIYTIVANLLEVRDLTKHWIFNKHYFVKLNDNQ